MPFSQEDPISKKRKQEVIAKGQDPFRTIDIPDMLLRLKQGAGRLIRCASDRGIISCLDSSYKGTFFENDFLQAFPPGTLITNSLSEVKSF